MNSFLLNKNTVVLLLASAVGIGFFIAGVLGILDYFIVKLLLFGGFFGLLILTIRSGLKNENKKNRPDHNNQDVSV